MTNKSDVFLYWFAAYAIVGFLVAIGTAVAGKLGPRGWGVSSPFLETMWLWPMFIVAIALDLVVSKRKH